MSTESFLFVFGAFLCCTFALLATGWGPWRTMLTGVAIGILGAAWGLDLVSSGQIAQRQFAIGLGQIFMVFSSVIGGALVSVAFAELRAKRRQATNGVAQQLIPADDASRTK